MHIEYLMKKIMNQDQKVLTVNQLYHNENRYVDHNSYHLLEVDELIEECLLDLMMLMMMYLDYVDEDYIRLMWQDQHQIDVHRKDQHRNQI
jgi:hypothetical protein